MRGRKPTPTTLKLINGNPGKRAINANEPIIDAHDGAAPEWMTGRQKEIWDSAVKSCPPGLITKVDESVLTTWVIAVDLHRQASEKVSQLGLVIKSPTKGEPMQNPWLSIMNRQSQIIAKASAELGFTPSSRSRVSVPAGQGDGNPFAALVK